MNEKIINLNESVFELTQKHPEIIDVLVELGFNDIKNPAIRKTMGKFMTIPKGAAMKKKDLNIIIKHLESLGYQIINEKEQ